MCDQLVFAYRQRHNNNSSRACVRSFFDVDETSSAARGHLGSYYCRFCRLRALAVLSPNQQPQSTAVKWFYQQSQHLLSSTHSLAWKTYSDLAWVRPWKLRTIWEIWDVAKWFKYSVGKTLRTAQQRFWSESCWLLVEQTGWRGLIYRISHDNANVTVDSRRTSGLRNILGRTQGFS